MEGSGTELERSNPPTSNNLDCMRVPYGRANFLFNRRYRRWLWGRPEYIERYITKGVAISNDGFVTIRVFLDTPPRTTTIRGGFFIARTCVEDAE
jgi:hypothetical protein